MKRFLVFHFGEDEDNPSLKRGFKCDCDTIEEAVQKSDTNTSQAYSYEREIIDTYYGVLYRESSKGWETFSLPFPEDKVCPFGYGGCVLDNGKWYHRDDCWDSQYTNSVEKVREAVREIDRLEKDER